VDRAFFFFAVDVRSGLTCFAGATLLMLEPMPGAPPSGLMPSSP
jgi:hypothetical protein